MRPPSLLALVVLLVSTHAVGVLGFNFTICGVFANGGNGALFDAFLHARFATSYYAAKYQSTAAPISWNFRLIGVAPVANASIADGNAVSTARQVLNSYLLASQGCTATIGPGISSLSFALSPLINQPWVDFGSMSADLSDYRNIPTLTRIVPAENLLAAGVAVLLKNTFQWSHMIVLCADNSYGRAVAAGFSSAFVAAGGTITVSKCLDPATTTQDIVTSTLLDFINSGSRIVYVAVGRPENGVIFSTVATAKPSLLGMIINGAAALQSRLVFVFSDNACSFSNEWTAVNGALCVTNRGNISKATAYLVDFLKRNKTADVAAFAALGYDARSLVTRTSGGQDYNVPGLWTTFAAIDTVRLLMAGLAKTATSTPVSDIVNGIRNTSLPDGLTGDLPVRVDTITSVRKTSLLVVLNAVPGLGAVPLLYTEMNWTAPSARPGGWLTQGYLLGAAADAGSIPSDLPPTTAEISTGILIGVLAMVVAIIVFIGVAYKLLSSNTDLVLNIFSQVVSRSMTLVVRVAEEGFAGVVLSQLMSGQLRMSIFAPEGTIPPNETWAQSDLDAMHRLYKGYVSVTIICMITRALLMLVYGVRLVQMWAPSTTVAGEDDATATGDDLGNGETKVTEGGTEAVVQLHDLGLEQVDRDAAWERRQIWIIFLTLFFVDAPTVLVNLVVLAQVPSDFVFAAPLCLAAFFVGIDMSQFREVFTVVRDHLNDGVEYFRSFYFVGSRGGDAPAGGDKGTGGTQMESDPKELSGWTSWSANEVFDVAAKPPGAAPESNAGHPQVRFVAKAVDDLIVSARMSGMKKSRLIAVLQVCAAEAHFRAIADEKQQQHLQQQQQQKH